ncbi:UvrY/SirA/GacA family response regulator transcription factor [Larkinella ripae]
MYSILVVDDHAIVRSGIRFLLRDYFGNVKIDEASNGSVAFRKILDASYDLVMMDINLPNTDTFSLLDTIRKMSPGLPILIFTSQTEYAFAKRYVQCGIKGYLSKQAEDREILNSVLAMLSGKTYFSEDVRDKMINDDHLSEEVDPFSLLSNREFEIVNQLIRGKSVSCIADSLNIHTSTVGTHKARIFDKLNVDNLIVLRDLAGLYRFI